MNRSLALCVAVALGLTVRSAQAPAAEGPMKRMFAVSMEISESKDGQSKMLAEPMMIVREGEETTFRSGGDVPDSNRAATCEYVPFGLQARMTVRQTAGDKLRVSLYVGGDDLTVHDGEDFTVRQSGARCVKTIKPGDTISLDMGEGRSARVAVLPVGGK